jgi:hypothetical protein
MGFLLDSELCALDVVLVFDVGPSRVGRCVAIEVSVPRASRRCSLRLIFLLSSQMMTALAV